MKEILLAGATSNVGKTTISLGLMQALIKRGYKVQPYKVGPDYVDTYFHQQLTGRDSINLDQFMVKDPSTLKGLYYRAFEGTDLAFIEGVMGLYDGIGTDKLACSSAGLALALDLPVLLVIDGSGTSTSAAALVKGFLEFEPRLNFAGIIINKLSSDSHYQLIKKSIEKYNDIEVFGYIKKNDDLSIPSQKKGLVREEERQSLKRRVDIMADQIEETVDLDRLIEAMETGKDRDEKIKEASKLLEDFHNFDGKGLSLAYAYDKAFSFYYPDNLEIFRKNGIRLIEFSPLKDKALPQADGYYIGGGYPEKYMEDLAANTKILEELRLAHKSSKPIFAEGEGLLYLATDFERHGQSYKMAGIFEGRGEELKRMKNFGYSEMTLLKECPIGKKGQKIRGHEYHYSDFETREEPIGSFVKKRDGSPVKKWKSSYLKKNTLASFQHIHLYQDKSLIENWIKSLKESNVRSRN